MKDYFSLQYKMICRKLKSAGINPLFAILIGVVGFVLISDYIFQKTSFANYWVLLVAFGNLLKLTNKNLTELFRITFGNWRTIIVRIIENLVISLPFIVLLVLHNLFLESAILLVVVLILAIQSFQIGLNFVIPTPFSKNPFEFTVGFRKRFLLFPLAFVITLISINVRNMPHSVFSLLLVFLISISFYLSPEKEYFVSTFSESPKSFLYRKIRQATLNNLILTLPILIILLSVYPKNVDVILLWYFFGIVFLWVIVLAKYSVYPENINLQEEILIVICIYAPPALIAVIPFFYNRAKKN